jgi:hydroxymethylglutaryl-CoA lyase
MVTISEVGLRDGLQIEPDFVATGDKVGLVDALGGAGIPKIEVTGFAHPKIVPQLRDAEDVLKSIERRPGTRYAAYVPNVRGAERALSAGVDEVKAGFAASQTFNQLNVRMPTEAAVKAFRDIAALIAGGPVRIVGVIGTAFGCPYEGRVAPDAVLRLIEAQIDGGARTIYLADTTGMANPQAVVALIEQAMARWPEVSFGLHLHNTRGIGIANALAGLEVGVREFESSIGGLGGCPYAPRAVGNICTEDFVHMLHEMGYQTGIDLDALIDAAKLAERILGRVLPGMVMKAGKASDLHDPALKRG